MAGAQNALLADRCRVQKQRSLSHERVVKLKQRTVTGVTRRGYRGLLQTKITQLHSALWTRSENNLKGTCFGSYGSLLQICLPSILFSHADKLEESILFCLNQSRLVGYSCREARESLSGS